MGRAAGRRRPPAARLGGSRRARRRRARSRANLRRVARAGRPARRGEPSDDSDRGRLERGRSVLGAARRTASESASQPDGPLFLSDVRLVRPEAAAPAVVLLVFDTTRHDAVGFGGCPDPSTPNLDAILAQGLEGAARLRRGVLDDPVDGVAPDRARPGRSRGFRRVSARHRRGRSDDGRRLPPRRMVHGGVRREPDASPRERFRVRVRRFLHDAIRGRVDHAAGRRDDAARSGLARDTPGRAVLRLDSSDGSARSLHAVRPAARQDAVRSGLRGADRRRRGEPAAARRSAASVARRRAASRSPCTTTRSGSPTPRWGSCGTRSPPTSASAGRSCSRPITARNSASMAAGSTGRRFSRRRCACRSRSGRAEDARCRRCRRPPSFRSSTCGPHSRRFSASRGRPASAVPTARASSTRRPGIARRCRR